MAEAKHFQPRSSLQHLPFSLFLLLHLPAVRQHFMKHFRIRFQLFFQFVSDDSVHEIDQSHSRSSYDFSHCIQCCTLISAAGQDLSHGFHHLGFLHGDNQHGRNFPVQSFAYRRVPFDSFVTSFQYLSDAVLSIYSVRRSVRDSSPAKVSFTRSFPHLLYPSDGMNSFSLSIYSSILFLSASAHVSAILSFTATSITTSSFLPLLKTTS